MKISTKGRYALRLMIDIGQHQGQGYVPIRTIAQRQGISEKYLEQIITVLNKSGYVKSVRGAAGGYFLAKEPHDYLVGDILRLTEGSLAPVACVDEEIDCPNASHCATTLLWEQLYEAINSVVNSVTLADLIEKQEALGLIPGVEKEETKCKK